MGLAGRKALALSGNFSTVCEIQNEKYNGEYALHLDFNLTSVTLIMCMVSKRKILHMEIDAHV